jgi:hypothetical protein
MSGCSPESGFVKSARSKIVLGTMRMDLRRHPLSHWVELVLRASEVGVVRMHCSDEYESVPFLLDVLRAARSIQSRFEPQFVVKLAEPHFGFEGFDSARFRSRLDSYRDLLRVDRLDSVQWMWRGDLKDETGRLAGFAKSSDIVASAFEGVKVAGAARRIHCFPYTAGFAEAALLHPQLDGIAVYRNPLEMEYEPLVVKSQQFGKEVLVIRPFKAGEALGPGGADELIKFSARVPAVAGIVVSCSSVAHLAHCVEAATRC